MEATEPMHYCTAQFKFWIDADARLRQMRAAPSREIAHVDNPSAGTSTSMSHNVDRILRKIK